MVNQIKISAKLKGSVADVKSLMLHPMETGARKDPDTGNTIPVHHITQLIFTNNGKLVKVGPSRDKRKSSKRFTDSGQKLEDVVSYIEYDPDKEPPRGPSPGKGKKKGGLFKFGKK